MFGRLSSRHTLIARSGFEKSLTITGVILDSHSSSDSFFPIFITDVNTFGPPPPNSIDFRSSGRTLTQKNSSGKSSATSSNSLHLGQLKLAPWLPKLLTLRTLLVHPHSLVQGSLVLLIA